MATSIYAPRPVIGQTADPYDVPGAAWLGTGQALYPKEWDEIAHQERIDPAFLRAVAYLESRSHGFDRFRRVSIEFVPWQFGAHTNHAWTGQSRYGHITTRNMSLSLLGRPPHGPYKQYDDAAELDEIAAIKATGMGLFRLHGFNFADAGFASPEGMLEDMRLGERQQVAAWLRWAGESGALRMARMEDIEGFARIQNGARWRVNRYGERLLHLRQSFVGGREKWVAQVLSPGASGPAVTYMQERLVAHLAPDRALVVDGYFGRATREALIEIQQAHDLPPDGICGRRTWEVLRAAPQRRIDELIGEVPSIGGAPRDLTPVEPMPAEIRQRPGVLARMSDWIAGLFGSGGALEIGAQFFGWSLSDLPAHYYLIAAVAVIALALLWLWKRPS